MAHDPPFCGLRDCGAGIQECSRNRIRRSLFRGRFRIDGKVFVQPCFLQCGDHLREWYILHRRLIQRLSFCDAFFYISEGFA